jgi:hypothetical protein
MDQLSDIFAHIYTSDHHQYNTAYNALGVPALKNMELYLPEIFVTKVNQLRQNNKALKLEHNHAKANEIQKLFSRNLAKKLAHADTDEQKLYIVWHAVKRWLKPIDRRLARNIIKMAKSHLHEEAIGERWSNFTGQLFTFVSNCNRSSANLDSVLHLVESINTEQPKAIMHSRYSLATLCTGSANKALIDEPHEHFRASHSSDTQASDGVNEVLYDRLKRVLQDEQAHHYWSEKHSRIEKFIQKWLLGWSDGLLPKGVRYMKEELTMIEQINRGHPYDMDADIALATLQQLARARIGKNRWLRDSQTDDFYHAVANSHTSQGKQELNEKLLQIMEQQGKYVADITFAKQTAAASCAETTTMDHNSYAMIADDLSDHQCSIAITFDDDIDKAGDHAANASEDNSESQQVAHPIDHHSQNDQLLHHTNPMPWSTNDPLAEPAEQQQLLSADKPTSS